MIKIMLRTCLSEYSQIDCIRVDQIVQQLRIIRSILTHGVLYSEIRVLTPVSENTIHEVETRICV